MKLSSVLMVLIFSSPTYANSILKDYSVYFFGLVKHFKLTPKTHEGNVEYLAISKTYSIDSWHYENGLGTYVDSYSLRSYKLFTNVSHDKYTYGIFKPLIGFVIHYKGKNYNSNDKRVVLGPTIQLRIGKNTGLFTNILIVPKIGTLTNGFAAFEFGYKF